MLEHALLGRVAHGGYGVARQPPGRPAPAPGALATEYIKAIPNAVIEVARIDGAGSLRIVLAIVLPMSVPIAASVAILDITNLWNEFARINILVSKTELKSMPLRIYSEGMSGGLLARPPGEL